MKRYIRSSKESKKFVGRTYSDLIQSIENNSSYTVDSAYRRERRGDPWILLIGSNGETYTAEYTKYLDGSFELVEYNIHRNNNQPNDVG